MSLRFLCNLILLDAPSHTPPWCGCASGSYRPVSSKCQNDPASPGHFSDLHHSLPDAQQKNGGAYAVWYLPQCRLSLHSIWSASRSLVYSSAVPNSSQTGSQNADQTAWHHALFQDNLSLLSWRQHRTVSLSPCCHPCRW